MQIIDREILIASIMKDFVFIITFFFGRFAFQSIFKSFLFEENFMINVVEEIFPKKLLILKIFFLKDSIFLFKSRGEAFLKPRLSLEF